MKHALPVLALLALTACGAAPTASDATIDDAVMDDDVAGTLSASLMEPGEAREIVMLVCDASSPGDCTRAGVVTDGAHVERMRTVDGWMMMASSACVDDRCTATDVEGKDWTMEP